jgi:hypothetical protein
MIVSLSSGEVHRFRQRPFKFQQTFKTPLDELPEFVEAILYSSIVNEATLTLDQIVFEPKGLLKLLEVHGLQKKEEDLEKSNIKTVGRDNVVALLEAALSDWVDFLFFHHRIVLYCMQIMTNGRLYLRRAKKS